MHLLTEFFITFGGGIFHSDRRHRLVSKQIGLVRYPTMDQHHENSNYN